MMYSEFSDDKHCASVYFFPSFLILYLACIVQYDGFNCVCVSHLFHVTQDFAAHTNIHFARLEHNEMHEVKKNVIECVVCGQLHANIN